MELIVHGKNMALTEALKVHVEKKLGKLEKFLDGIQGAQVVLEVEKGQHICEVTVPLAGAVLRGEARTNDMYSAVDDVVQKLERQIRRYKARFQKNGKAPADTTAPFAHSGDEIVRQKKIPLKPMDPDEAIMQMNLVGHDFFVFTNAETELVNVIYRRRDGRYGLLEPDM